MLHRRPAGTGGWRQQLLFGIRASGLAVLSALGCTDSGTEPGSTAGLKAILLVRAQRCQVGADCNFLPVTASGGSLPYQFAIGISLPDGLTLDASTGRIRGVALSPGPVEPVTYRVTVTEAGGSSAFQTFTLAVRDELSLSQLLQRSWCHLQLNCLLRPVTANGGKPPYVFSATGQLPSGLTFDPATAAFTGVPTALADVSFQMSVRDAEGLTAGPSLFRMLVVEQFAVTVPAAEVFCEVDLPCQLVPLEVLGGLQPYRFVLGTGTLPAGLTLDPSDGRIIGVPITPASVTLGLSVTDQLDVTIARNLQLAVVEKVKANVAIPQQNCSAGSPCTFSAVYGTAGLPPYRYALAAGTIPPGMVLDPTSGAMTGSAAAPAEQQLLIRVTDSLGATDSAAFRLTIVDGLSTTQVLFAKGCTARAPCNATPVTASGGRLPYTFSYDGDQLPAGLQFDPTVGTFSGTPTTPDTADLRIVVTDANEATSSRNFQLIVNPPLTTVKQVAVQECLLGALCSFIPVTATGGTPSYTFSVSGLPLPSGMTFNSLGGQFVGIPTTSATLTLTVLVTDAAGAQSSQLFDLLTFSPLTTTLVVPQKQCAVGAACGFTPVTASGGVLPVTFGLAGAALPPGLSFSPLSGTISGTPTATGSGSFTVTALDSRGHTSSKNFTLTVGAALSTTLVVPQQTCEIGTDCRFTPVTAAGGTTPYTFSVSGDPLPAGLGFSTSTGAFSGTATAAGTSAITVTVADANGSRSSKNFQLVVSTPRPGVVRWINSQGGQWTVPQNWSPARLPRADDTVDVTLAGGYVVTLDTTASLAALVLGNGTGQQRLELVGRTLTSATGMTVRGGGVLALERATVGGGPVVNQVGGMLELRESVLNLDLENRGQLMVLASWGTGAAARINGTFTTTVDSRIQIVAGDVRLTPTDAPAALLTATGFVNRGRISFNCAVCFGRATSTLRAIDGTFINEAGGVMDGGNPTVAQIFAPTVVNRGQIAVTAAGLLVLNAPGQVPGGMPLSVVHNSGSLQVAHGLLSGIDTFENSGRLEALDGSGALSIQATTASSLFLNTGEVVLGLGRSLDLVGGAVRFPSGSMTGSGTLSVTGSVADFGAPLNVGVNTPKTVTFVSTQLSVPGLTNEGAGVVSIRNTNVGSTMPFVNAPGGTLLLLATTFAPRLDNRGSLSIASSSSFPRPVVLSALTTSAGSSITMEAVASETVLQLPQGFVNNGDLNMTIGNGNSTWACTMVIQSGTFVNGGTGRIYVPRGFHQILGQVTNNGTLEVGPNGFLDVNTNTDISVPNSPTNTRPIANTGTITVNGGRLRLFPSGLTNSGTIVTTGPSGGIGLEFPATTAGLSTSGDIRLAAGTFLSVVGAPFVQTAGSVDGGGRLALSGVAGTFAPPLAIGPAGVDTLDLANSSLSAGQVSMASGGLLRLVNSSMSAPAPLVNPDGGTISLAGSTLNLDLSNAGVLEVQGAAIRSEVNGSLTTTASSSISARAQGGTEAVLYVPGGMTNNGSLALVGQGQDGAGVILGSGSLINSGTGTINVVPTGFGATLAAPIVNQGQLTVQASGGTLFVAGSLTNTGSVMANGNISVSGALVTPAGTNPVLTGNGSLLRTVGLDVSGATFDNIRLTSSGGNLTTFNGVTFRNMDPLATQLSITHPGATAAFTFDRISFLTPPTTGLYLQVNDQTPGAPVLTIDLTNSTPVDGSARTGTQGGAIVNWR
jgi:hypothetical protein